MIQPALLLVAHGSRREASNQEIRQLTQRLRARLGSQFAAIECAFLELAEPSIPQGIQQAIDRGAEQVLIMPYFLSAGRHVAEDIPREVAAKQAANPAIELRLLPYLGELDGLIGLLAKAITHQHALHSPPALCGAAD